MDKLNFVVNLKYSLSRMDSLQMTSGVFRFEIRIPSLLLTDVLEVAVANSGEKMASLAVPALVEYVATDSMVQLDEGTGGAIMKVRCLENRQSVIVKVLKRFIEASPVKRDGSDISAISSSINGMSISRSHSIKSVRHPLAKKSSSCSLSTLSSATDLFSNDVIQLEPKRKAKLNYPFDSLNEYMIMKKAQSVHIAPVYALLNSIDEEDGLPNLCLMMDLYQDSDLLSLLTKVRKLSIPISSHLKDEMFLQVIQGVKYLHSKNIVHRDLKPENILIDADGKLRICDFGYAMDLDLMDLYPITDVSFITRGTGSFKAPELLSYFKSSNDQNITNGEFTMEKFKASDVWSLGVMYYQMKFLSKPWNTSTFEDSCYKWFSTVYRKYKLDTISSGFEIKQKLALSGSPNVTSSKSMSKTNSSSSMRARSTSNVYSLRTHPSQQQFQSVQQGQQQQCQQQQQQGDSQLVSSFKSLKDSSLFGLIKMLNPDWESRGVLKEVLRCEWLVNTRLSIEERRGKENEDMISLLKMVRRA